MPELFIHEINKLDAKDRARFQKPRLSYTRADGELLEVDNLTSIERTTELDRL